MEMPNSLMTLLFGSSSQPIENDLVQRERCCKFYPSFQTYCYLGVVHYRLGNFDKAIEPLLEALRMEPFEYGQGDNPPYIEAFLAMGYLKVGKIEKAEEFRKRLVEIVSKSQWENDRQVQEILDEVNETFRQFATVL